MASAIDPTKPVAGNPTTESVRLNFAAAKSEIEVLQQTAGVGPKGDTGPPGPSGTISVGTVTTGAAGTSASITNTGSATAATLNFTIPRGDAGTGGSGITETQAKDAVRRGNVRFEEVPETTGVTFPTTPNLAQPPVVGANWTPQTGGTATQAYTHDIGSTEGLAYPATIANGTMYQVVFSVTNVSATSTVTGQFITAIYFRTGPTTTTGQQTIVSNLVAGATVTIMATGNFSHVVVIPNTAWQGNFTMTRVTAFSGEQNSASLSVKDWETVARGNSLYIGGGGHVATSSPNIALGRDAMKGLTSGSSNIAIGGNALSNGGNQTNNIAIGFNALQYATTGSNVAVGHNALQNHVTNPAQTGMNTAVGNSALNNGYSADRCVGIGSGAFQNPNGAVRSMAVGVYAMWQCGTASSPICYFNTAVGEWAMGQINGNNNTGIGSRALSPTVEGPTQVTGSNLTALGYKAGAHISGGGNLTTLEDSVFLGTNTKAAANGEHNQIVIGHNATGHGSDTITLGNDEITHLHCHVQTISALSDSRVKENIQAANLDTCLNAVKNLPVSEWDWLPIAGPHPDKHDIGFVSDDVAKVFPSAISKEDRFLTMRNADGTAQLTTVTDSVPDDWGNPSAPRHIETRQVEKTLEIKGLQYVSTSQMLPTLWAAVQRLIEKNEALEQQISQMNPSSSPSNPAEPQSKGLFRKR